MNPAALYCLLPNKTSATYNRVVDEIMTLVPSAKPEVILTDFESAAMGVLRSRFPSARVTGCYFHLTQSVLRKVNEVGLKVAYETRDDVRGSIRSSSALAHVPLDDVVESFELLADAVTDAEHMDEVLTYFEHTHIRGRRQRGRGNN